MERGEEAQDGAALMARCKSGDVAAFEELVRRYRRRVFGLVERVLGRNDGVEDVAQEVFVRVYGARETYEPRARFETWLYRIVLNLCLNAAARARQRRTLSLDRPAGRAGDDAEDEGIAVADDSAPAPLEALERDEVRERVRSAIARLPAQQRAALVLHRYGGLSLAEVAAEMETSEEAVKSLLHRAREKLRAWLSPYLREEARGGGDGL